MARTLHDFLNRHAGETAWLFGKGPSLDRFLENHLADAGPLRCAINDVVKEIPGCVYGFANDAVGAWAHVYTADHTLFTPLRTWEDNFLQGWGGPPNLPCEVVTYEDTHDDDRLLWPRERLAREGLTIRPGTLGSALQILHIMGVVKVVLVGIDGGRVHSRRHWFTELRNDHARDYGHIRTQAAASARLMGLPLHFIGADPILNPNLTVTVKFLTSTQVGGDAYPAGAIADIPDDDYRTLLGLGYVRPFVAVSPTQTVASPEESPAPEREAAAAAPATETANTSVTIRARSRQRVPSA